MPAKFIEFVSPDDGLTYPLSIEDLRAANKLLERLSMDVDGAIAAVQCAAEIRPRVFNQTESPPSDAVRDWNERVPVGSPVRFWPFGRDLLPQVSRTASAAFDLVGMAGVLVEDYECAISLADVEGDTDSCADLNPGLPVSFRIINT